MLKVLSATRLPGGILKSLGLFSVITWGRGSFQRQPGQASIRAIRVKPQKMNLLLYLREMNISLAKPQKKLTILSSEKVRLPCKGQNQHFLCQNRKKEKYLLLSLRRMYEIGIYAAPYTDYVSYAIAFILESRD